MSNVRKKKVVGKFVEFYGSGLSSLSLADRATIANMAPEYGATMGFFPVDAETLKYMRLTGRPEELVQLAEAYTKAQGLFRTDDTPDPTFQSTLFLDLGTVEPSVAGPKRPQDRVVLGDIQRSFHQALTTPAGPQGFGLSEEAVSATGANGSPGFGRTRNATSSAPAAPTSRSRRSTRNSPAPSASVASAPDTAAANGSVTRRRSSRTTASPTRPRCA